MYATRIDGGRIMKDSIVEEVRAVRDEYAAKLKYNLHDIAEDARRHQRKSGRQIIKLASHTASKSRRVHS